MDKLHFPETSYDLSYSFRGQYLSKRRIADISDLRISVIIDTAKNDISVIEHCKMVLHAEAAAVPGIVNGMVAKGVPSVAEYVSLEKNLWIDFHNIPFIGNEIIDAMQS